MSEDTTAASPWIGSTYRHVPVEADVLNFEFAGLYGDNRWNRAGERTVHLAADQGVLAAEWARLLVATTCRGPRPHPTGPSASCNGAT